MTVKEYLSQHKNLTISIRKDEESLAFLCPAVADPHASRLNADCVRVSPRQEAPFVGNMEYIDRLKENLALKKTLLKDLEQEIHSVFSVLDPYIYVLMTRRYLDHEQWDEIISNTMGCKASVLNWHKQALAQCVLPENPIDIGKYFPALRKAS